MNNQLALPVSVSADQIARKKTLGAAIELCAEVAGFDLDKTLALDLGVDKGQFSRWLSGQEGIHWSKFSRLMDACGNDAPLLWMLHQRGYEITSLHKRESETERALRVAQEELAAERAARLAVEDSMRRILTGSK